MLWRSRTSGFETGPAKLTSEFGKSAVFEIGTFDSAGASFATERALSAPSRAHWQTYLRFPVQVCEIVWTMTSDYYSNDTPITKSQVPTYAKAESAEFLSYKFQNVLQA